MAIKISQLATLTTLYGNTLIPVVDTVGTNVSKKIEASTLRSFFANVATGGDSANLTINSALVPDTDNSYNLGSSSYTYANLHLSGTTFTSGAIRNTSNVQSASTSTGAITIAGVGGLGVGGNINAGNVNTTYATGTLLTAAQPYVTSVGTLTSLGVTGNVTANGFIGVQYGNVFGNISGATGTYTGNVTASGFVGTLYGNVAGGTSASYSANVTAGGFVGTLYGNVAGGTSASYSAPSR